MIRLTFIFLLFLILEIHGGATSRLRPNSTQVPPIHISKKIFGIHKTTVMIINDLENGHNLQVHCKSKNNDLGAKVIQPNMQYTFKFQPNVFSRNTLFFCSFIWAGENFKYFEIYRENRDDCRKCIWLIRPYGSCLSLGNDYICYTWRT